MTKIVQPVQPVQRSVSVPLEPAAAFALFTARTVEFWPRAYSIGRSQMVDLVVEPHAGGRWFERGSDGTTCPWGRVEVWDPPRRVVLVWQISADWTYDPELETRVELTFTPEGPGTRVDLEHRDLDRYGDRSAALRATFDGPQGWNGILAAFAGHA